ncbi:MAG TPA: 2-oxoacid:acceptor oxidoreductase subunit alpha [Bdellovibrionota bacterium]|nr:2-oxoacid:acceptor oxidoreductase subunit alpha [Bdellovibrionota bacterium]
MNSPNKINDFCIDIATVNGTGSVSANVILSKTFVALGVHIAPKNIFPSNIQGLPTWFRIRVSPKAYRCSKEGVDFAVLLNPATATEDLNHVRDGGVVIFDSDEISLPPAGQSRLITSPVPITTLAKDLFKNPRQRQFAKNMIYVGAVTELLGIAESVVDDVVRKQFEKKPDVFDFNYQAIKSGRKWLKEHPVESPFELIPNPLVKERFLIEGNESVAWGALYGGCTLLAWYPITPATGIGDSINSIFPKHRTDSKSGKRKYAVVQAEDELAAIGMVLGGGWAGARAMTVTSGPGISLMAEFVGLGYYAEVPAVIVDVQRVGPSTGLPTRTSQQDIGFVATLSHGDTKHPMLLPASPTECFEMTQMAFDLADRFLTPVFVMTDLDLGMNIWLTEEFKAPTKPIDRGKILTENDAEKLKTCGRYLDVDGDGIPYRALPGTPHPKAAVCLRGTGHDEFGTYSENPVVFSRNLSRLDKKFETLRVSLPQAIVHSNKHNSVGVIAYGTTHWVMEEAIDCLGKNAPDYIRLLSFPFADNVEDFIKNHEKVIVIEQNRDVQMCRLLQTAYPKFAGRIVGIGNCDGWPLTAERAIKNLKPFLEGGR